MHESFDYGWEEAERRTGLHAGMPAKALLLSVAVASAYMLLGHAPGSVPVPLQAGVMAACPVVMVACSVAWYMKGRPRRMVSAIHMEGRTVSVTRHVTAESGRRYVVTWSAEDILSVKARRQEHVLRIEAVWRVAAFQDRRGGKEMDSSVRQGWQTVKLDGCAFEKAVAWLERHGAWTGKGGRAVQDMTEAEFAEARPFLEKHHGA